MCVAAPGGGAETSTKPSVLSNPVFPAVKYILCFSYWVGKENSANSIGSDLPGNYLTKSSTSRDVA